MGDLTVRLNPGDELRCPKCDGSHFTVVVDANDNLNIVCASSVCAAWSLTLDSWDPDEAVVEPRVPHEWMETVELGTFCKNCMVDASESQALKPCPRSFTVPAKPSE